MVFLVACVPEPNPQDQPSTVARDTAVDAPPRETYVPTPEVDVWLRCLQQVPLSPEKTSGVWYPITTDTRVGVCHVGAAAVLGEDYVGVEEFHVLHVTPHNRSIAPLCVMRYTVGAVARRDDCVVPPNLGPVEEIPCVWAFDLQISDAEILYDRGGCLGAVGLDAVTVDGLNGTLIGRGFTDQLFHHSREMLELVDGEWMLTDGGATYDGLFLRYSHMEGELIDL